MTQKESQKFKRDLAIQKTLNMCDLILEPSRIDEMSLKIPNSDIFMTLKDHQQNLSQGKKLIMDRLNIQQAGRKQLTSRFTIPEQSPTAQIPLRLSTRRSNFSWLNKTGNFSINDQGSPFARRQTTLAQDRLTPSEDLQEDDLSSNDVMSELNMT